MTFTTGTGILNKLWAVRPSVKSVAAIPVHAVQET